MTLNLYPCACPWESVPVPLHAPVAARSEPQVLPLLLSILLEQALTNPGASHVI